MVTRRGRMVPAVLLISACMLPMASAAFADAFQDALQEGRQLYKEKSYDEAIRAFTPAAEARDRDIVKEACVYIGHCHMHKEAFDEAAAWYERALEKDGDYLWALESLSVIWFRDRSTYLKGKALAERAAALNDREPTIYYNLARCHALAGDAERAFRCLDMAIYFGRTDVSSLSAEDDFKPVLDREPFSRLCERHGSVVQGKALQNLAAKKSRARAYRDARVLYTAALHLYEQALGADSLTSCSALRGLGDTSSDEGAFDAAIECHERALAIESKALGTEHPDVALSCGRMGSACYSKGDYDRAVDWYEKALAIRLKALGAEHPDVALSYNNLGYAYSARGENDRAIGCYEKSLAIGLKVLGAEHPDVAASYNNLGYVYYIREENDRAIGCYEKALAIVLKLLGPEHEYVANCYNNLGSAYDSKKEPDRAIEYYEKALAIRLKALGAEHPDVAVSYNNLGCAYFAKGENDRGIGYYEKSLAIKQKVLGAEHPDVAVTCNNLAFAYESKGEYERAFNCYARALEIAKKTGDRHTIIVAANNLGKFALGRDRIADARQALREGIAAIEQTRASTGADKTELTARSIELYYLSLLVNARMNDLGAVFETAEALRARGFLDRLSLSAALSVEGVPAETREKMLALSDQIESLARQRSSEIRKTAADRDTQSLLSIFSELQEKEKELARLDTALMGNSRYKELRSPSFASLREAREMLGADEAILEYVIWEKGEHRQAWCLLIRRTGMELVEMDKAFPYSEAVTDFRRAILDGSANREELGRHLYDKLIGVLAGKLSGVRALIIVPDGALAFLPFDALRGDAARRYLCEDYQVTLAPSVSVLRMVEGRNRASRPGQWLAFGGARYSSVEAQARRGRGSLIIEHARGDRERRYCASRGAGRYYDALGLQWEDLPGTREEVEAIQREVFGGAGTVVMLGEQASEKRVKELSASGELAHQRIVHFACHGRYDAEFPAYSSVVLSEVSGMLRNDSTEDGYLDLEEVALLKLDADMVTLSACETGLGKVVNGDGVIGLTRAFLVAGASRVGATLWVVDDLATKDFMVKVYKLSKEEGLSSGQAMMRAKREFIHSADFSDPYYWSPFVLYGRN